MSDLRITNNQNDKIIIDNEIWRGKVIINVLDDFGSAVILLRKHHVIKVVKHLIKLFDLSEKDVGFDK